MSETIHWGIIGTGSIARKFAEGLAAAPGATLIAVGSRSAKSAEEFGAKFNAPHRHASYEALAADPDVQAVYIATPHVLHMDNTLLCINAGKAVLCEKPFTINAAQAKTVIAAAKKNKVFLMEAMWTRFLPVIAKARELVASGAIGELRILTADFGFRAGWNPQSRLLDPALGGGALLDVGVYTVSLASMFMGTPKNIAAISHVGETKIDEQTGMVLGSATGQLAVLHTAVRTNTPQDARLMGTDGSIQLPGFWHGQTLILNQAGKPSQTFELPYLGNGYTHEAIEVMNCLRAGKRESDIMPVSETLSVMKTMDKIRDKVGVKYPVE